MSAMPKEMFEKYAGEYQTKIQNNSQELMKLRTQAQQKDKDRKINELTLKELETVKDSACYRTVGKMFMRTDLTQVKQELKSKIENAEKELEALNKIALKVDGDLKDAERNMKSLIERVSQMSS